MKRAILLFTAAVLPLTGKIEEKQVVYNDGETELEGFFAHDPEAKQTGKAVLIVHQWTGLGDNEKMRARMLAKLGYKAFALDIYGKGIRPKPPESGKMAGKFKGDRKLYRQRLSAGLQQLKKLAKTEESNIAAIGYCFGGTGVLEIARASMPVAGVVSFHGGLGAASEMEAKAGQVKAKVLVLHGADDPFVPEKEVQAFKEEMKGADAKMEFVAYPGAVHAFTQKGAGDDPSKGAAYQKEADKKSWNRMKKFFESIFKGK